MAPTRRTRTRTAAPTPPTSAPATTSSSPSNSSSNAEPTSDLQEFNSRVYALVRLVPEGKVSSYGDIARYLSRPQNSRLVGSALKVLPRSFSSPYLPQVPLLPTNNDNAQGNSETDEPLPPPLPNPNFVPWHRILSSTGVISPRGNEMSVRRQREWLEAEGVEVEVGPRGGAGGGGGGNGGNGQGGTVDAFGLGGAGGGNGGGGGRVRIALYRWEGPE